MSLPSWSIHDETQDEPAEERVRLVKLGFLLTDAVVSQKRNGFEGAESVGEARSHDEQHCCITKNGFERAEPVDEAQWNSWVHQQSFGGMDHEGRSVASEGYTRMVSASGPVSFEVECLKSGELTPVSNSGMSAISLQRFRTLCFVS